MLFLSEIKANETNREHVETLFELFTVKKNSHNSGFVNNLNCFLHIISHKSFRLSSVKVNSHA